MIPAEILKKVKLIEIKTRNVVNELFGGEYHSAFKGSGMEFAEVREYIPGDDIRAIDWNVTARVGKPYIKKFDEERELSVVFMIDVSASGFFGTGESLKSDLMIELSSVLSFSALKNNDKVGLLLFSDKIEKFIPPEKGKSHILRLIRELIYFRSSDMKTDIGQSIEFIQKVLKRKSVIFLISDFIDNSFEKPLQYLNQKHDLINIHISDPAEKNIPQLGLVKLHDNETGKTYWVDTNLKRLSLQLTSKFIRYNSRLTSFCKKNKIDLVSINTLDGYMEPLISFFNKRINR